MSSLIQNPGIAIGKRIKALRESMPPPTDRITASRIKHPSQAEFAEMVGTDRYRVIDWETHGAIPERRFREKLAELSDGLYEQSDFTVDADEQSALVAAITQIAPSREEYQQEVRGLKQQLKDQRETNNKRYAELRDELATIREAL